MGGGKGIRDSLVAVDAYRWLVIRDRYSMVMECQRLRPLADLRAALRAERERRVREGWTAGEIPRNCSFFFCDRQEERVCIAIECFEPGSRSHLSWHAGR